VQFHQYLSASSAERKSGFADYFHQGTSAAGFTSIKLYALHGPNEVRLYQFGNIFFKVHRVIPMSFFCPSTSIVSFLLRRWEASNCEILIAFHQIGIMGNFYGSNLVFSEISAIKRQCVIIR